MNLYLDDAATTKPKKEVMDVIVDYCNSKWYNPSSLYSKSRRIHDDVESAREIIGSFINAKYDEIYFTSCGSESNSWAIQGFVKQCRDIDVHPVIITTNIEHKSIISCINEIGVNVAFIDVDSLGFVNKNMLRQNLAEYSCFSNYHILVSIQFANNEVGTIQNIKEISDIVHEYGGVLHTDATQAFGKVNIDVDSMGIDMLTASGHKIGCPKGIGFLYKRNSVDITPIIYGSQMDGMRGGTENVPYIMGMAKAVELLRCYYCCSYNTILPALRDYFISKLEDMGCTLNGSRDNRLCNNISVILPNHISGESMLYILDTSNIYISTGSACNSKSIEPSYVLKAIGLTDEEAFSTIRITLPDDIVYDDINKALSEIEKAIKLLSIK